MKISFYLRACRDVAAMFVTRPVESFRMLRVLPRMVESSQRGRKWPAGTWPATTEVIADSRPNPLLDYFQAHAEGPGIWKFPHYFDIYQRHFAKFVGREVHVVEVGVYSGGSLGMWRSYFGEACHIYGIDIEDSCRVYEDDVTRIFIGDQADRAFWDRFREVVPVVDILIDDGGHLAYQQIVTVEEMLAHLQPGGVYLCEDIGGARNDFAAYVCGLALQMNARTKSHAGHLGPEGINASIHSIHIYPLVAVIEKALRRVDKMESVRRGTEWQPGPLT